MFILNKLINRIFLLTAILSLTGCAADPNLPLYQGFWTDQPKPVVVVAMDTPSRADFDFNGAGLLDMAIILAVNQKFITYLHQYDISSLDKLSTQLVQNLNQHGIIAKKYNEKINLSQLKNSSKTNFDAYERKDFTPLASQLKANRLLLIHVSFIGSYRGYYGLVPLGAPSAVCRIEGRLVNLKTNRTLWRFSTNQEIKVTAPWSQPPSYPNFSNALNQAIDQANQTVLSNFFSSVPVLVTSQTKK
ncbi:MAG: hypothetical protein JSR33_05430 [Proteobacteria bacterium]|nr:hypothetical protein [Pseudomonadota bacterium]